MTPMKRPHHAGSVITYVLIMIFLVGLLTMSVTEGPKRSPTSQKLDNLVISLQSDLDLIEAAINDCVLVHPGVIDIDGDGDTDTTDNPNAPFPIRYTTAAGYDLGTSVFGNITDTICPSTPPAPIDTSVGPPYPAATTQQLLFSGQGGRGFKLLGDTATYTTTYSTDATEGVLVRITRATQSALWTEAADSAAALESALRERLNALEVGRVETVRAFAADAPPAKLAFYTRPPAGTPSTHQTLPR